ncbi:KRAB [Acanthosepion pharaonis]|uniref:KRAB n=1 Tax=Acanthosepion pharaonis TaxID=158019 RepID=A0A812BUG2_ACAPH|nr:KRAB [Sepia pharaonis]
MADELKTQLTDTFATHGLTLSSEAESYFLEFLENLKEDHQSECIDAVLEILQKQDTSSTDVDHDRCMAAVQEYDADSGTESIKIKKGGIKKFRLSKQYSCEICGKNYSRATRQFYCIPQILSFSFISFLYLLVGLQLLNTFTSLLPGLCLLAFCSL